MTGWDRFFASCDVLLAPGDADVRLGGGRGGRRRQPANAGRCGPDAVAGQRLPMIVIPAGTDNNGVPFAVQLIGPRWQAAAGSDGGQGSLRVVTGVSICAPEDVTVGPAGVDAAGQMGSQRGVLLARHCLHQGYRGGTSGCIIDHEDDVPLAPDDAVVVHALTGGCGVVVLSSGDEGIGLRLARCDRQGARLEGVRVRGRGEPEQEHCDRVAVTGAVVGDVVAADEMKAGGWISSSRLLPDTS